MVGESRSQIGGEEQPQVSVVIPTYGRPDAVIRAVDSVLAQSYSEIEIIVVDDNGRDTELARETRRRIERRLPPERGRYLQHEENRGACAARNTGIRHSRGEFVAFLDDDDQWKNSFVATMAALLDDAPSHVGAAYCGMIARFPSYGFEIVPDNRGYRGDIFKQLAGGWWPFTTSLLVAKRECLEAVDGFDESLQSFQDYDIWLRIARDYEFEYVDELLVVKNQRGGDQITFNPDARRAGMRRFLEKWEPTLAQHMTEEQLNKFKQHFTGRIEESLYLQKLSGSKWLETVAHLARVLSNPSLPVTRRAALITCMAFGRRSFDLIEAGWLRVKYSRLGGMLRQEKFK